MSDRRFQAPVEKNGLLHPPNCACVRCAAGRESQELDAPLLEKVNEKLEEAFLQLVQGNFMGGFQQLAAGQPIDVVRGGFLGNMSSIMRMREMAAAYFAQSEAEEV